MLFFHISWILHGVFGYLIVVMYISCWIFHGVLGYFMELYKLLVIIYLVV